MSVTKKKTQKLKISNLQQQWTCYDYKHQPHEVVADLSLSETEITTKNGVEESAQHTKARFCCICCNCKEQEYLYRKTRQTRVTQLYSTQLQGMVSSKQNRLSVI